MTETYSVWMRIPGDSHKIPFSRVAGGLNKDDAEWMVEALYFQARVMPDQQEEAE